MKRKASLQLSINFTVMLVLALIVFGLGISFLYKIMNKLDNATESLDDQTIKQIESLLINSGTKVAFPKNIVTIKRGGHQSIALGIKNEDPDHTYFKLTTDCTKGYDKDKTRLCDETRNIPCQDVCDKWVIHNSPGYSLYNIEKKARKVEGLFINIPKTTKTGEYIFTLEVKTALSNGVAQDDYDTAKKFYVRVI